MGRWRVCGIGDADLAEGRKAYALSCGEGEDSELLELGLLLGVELRKV